MPTFAFWNTKRPDIEREIASLIAGEKIDFLAVAECNTDPNNVLRIVNPRSKSPFFSLTGKLSERIRVFSRLAFSSVILKRESSRYLIFEIKVPPIKPFQLMVLHAASQANWSRPAISHQLLDFARDLRALESETQNSKSIVMGDFNINPYDDGMIAANGFHAVMEEKEAASVSREIQGDSYDYFYNPMWNLFGDRTSGPPGTHYFRGSSVIEQQWHMLDQVIIRPQMLPYFDFESLRIVSESGGASFITPAGRPRERAVSDHFPIVFDIKPVLL